jgi:hypothetical protein
MNRTMLSKAPVRREAMSVPMCGLRMLVLMTVQFVRPFF